jgi:hypothetical protein
MNLLQCAPLCDSRGKVRYFIGAQIDVSGLAMEGAQMESLQNIQAQKENPSTNGSMTKESKSEFQELGELFSPRELQNVREHGGNLFQPIVNEDPNHRLFLQDSDTETEGGTQDQPPSQSNPTPTPAPSLSLAGVYKHVRSNPTTSPGIPITNNDTVPPHPPIPLHPHPLHILLPPNPMDAPIQTASATQAPNAIIY